MSEGYILLRRVVAFLREADMPPSAFGRAALRDPKFITDLRNGREPRRRVISQVDAFMHTWREDYRAGKIHPVGDRRFRNGTA